VGETDKSEKVVTGKSVNRKRNVEGEGIIVSTSKKKVEKA